MLFPHKVTIYNRIELDYEEYEYSKAVIEPALYVITDSSQQGTQGLRNDDVFTVYIPLALMKEALGKQYVEPSIYSTLTKEEKKNHYTIQKGDFIAAGVVKGVYASINELKNSNYRLFEITGTKEYNMGSLANITITGK